MRLVLWNSQERVDLPDMQASETSHLGEHRRLVRGLLIGPNGASFDNYLVRGFAVEASTVPDENIHVKLDPGGANPRSVAIGRDADFPDAYGTIVGGNDDQGNLEGNADYPLPFTGQPNGTYTVYMRFLFADGSNDNRAQWNPGLNTESVVAMDTQRLPSIELSLNPADPSDGWIPLADVAWAGATIVTGDITDVRSFVFEGSSPYQQTTKSGVGGMPDFSRSSARGTNGVNEVFPVLRALGRQIQDIKGQDDDGNLNWWARPAKPWDPDALLAGADFSRSMRSLETVTFTIGDGVNFFGDWNGVDGLDDCLAHLEACSVIPNRVIILLRGAEMSAGFNLGAHDLSAFTGKEVAIIGHGARAATTSGRTSVVATTTDATPLIDMPSGRLRLSGLSISGADNAAGGQALATTNTLVAEDCIFAMGEHTTTASTTTPLWEGNNLFLDRIGTSRGIFELSDSSNGIGRVTNSYFTSAHFTGDAAVFEMKDCQYASMTIYTALNTIIGVAAQTVKITGCDFDIGLGTAGVDLIRPDGGVVVISNNRFVWAGTYGSHAVNDGIHGADGSGWVIYADSSSLEKLTVSDNYFLGSAASLGFGTVDGGAIGVFGDGDITIKNNTFEGWGPGVSGGATARCRVICVDSSGVTGVLIDGNTVATWEQLAGVNAGAEGSCVYINDFDNARIINNVFTGRDAGAAITAFETYGLFIDSGNRGLAANNNFSGFETGAGILGDGTHVQWRFLGNAFYRCPGPTGDTVTGNFDQSNFSNNIFSENTSFTRNGIFVTGDNNVFMGNIFDVPANDDAITCTAATQVFMGNNLVAADLNGSIGSVGYAPLGGGDGEMNESTGNYV